MFNILVSKMSSKDSNSQTQIQVSIFRKLAAA